MELMQEWALRAAPTHDQADRDARDAGPAECRGLGDEGTGLQTRLKSASDPRRDITLTRHEPRGDPRSLLSNADRFYRGRLVFDLVVSSRSFLMRFTTGSGRSPIV